jgi:hypothetical protein
MSAIEHRLADATLSSDSSDEEDARRWIECAKSGDFESAWQLSDRIRQRSARRQDWSLPRHLQQVWNGASLIDRRVLIRCYHGLGDTIQFIRYAPYVRAIAREVIVWAQPSLLPLLATMPDIDRLSALHNGIPDVGYDVDVEVMELPYVFRSTRSTIPCDIPYLSAEPSSMPVTGRRVGIVWRAGDWNATRSIPFHGIERLFEFDRVTWYRLQHGTMPDEQHPRLQPLDTFGLLQTAQVMKALDLVITVDSMPAHLAGALGVPVWTLLSTDADWRWMRDVHASPWYPTMRLFRQRRPGEWQPVVAEVLERLRDMYP